MDGNTGAVMGLIGIFAVPLFTFLGVWYGKRTEFQTTKEEINANATTTARTVAAEQVEAFYGRITADNARLADEVEELRAQGVKRDQETLAMREEMLLQSRRLGSLEADNARLVAENETLRKEIDRLVNEVQRERGEKYELSRSLSEEQARVIAVERERQRMQREIDELRSEVSKLKESISGKVDKP